MPAKSRNTETVLESVMSEAEEALAKLEECGEKLQNMKRTESRVAVHTLAIRTELYAAASCVTAKPATEKIVGQLKESLVVEKGACYARELEEAFRALQYLRSTGDIDQIAIAEQTLNLSLFPL